MAGFGRGMPGTPDRPPGMGARPNGGRGPPGRGRICSAGPRCARLAHALRRRERVVTRARNPGATPSRSLTAGQSAGRTRPRPRAGRRPTDITRTRRRHLRDRAWGGRWAGSAGGWQLVCWRFAGAGLSIRAGRGQLTRPSLRRRLQRGARRRSRLSGGGTIGQADGRVDRRGGDARGCFAVGVSGGSRRLWRQPSSRASWPAAARSPASL